MVTCSTDRAGYRQVNYQSLGEQSAWRFHHFLTAEDCKVS